MDDRAPETKRRSRLAGPGAAFIVGILGLAAVVIAILLVAYFVFGLGAEGAEGP